MPVIDLRGGHGSGKSYLVHRIIKEYGPTEDIVDEDGDTIGVWVPKLDLRLAGRYNTTCGGCDTIRTQNYIQAITDSLIEDAGPNGNVLYEGALVSGIFGRYNEQAERWEAKGFRWHFLFLDTTLEQCFKNIGTRRVARGKEPEFNTKVTEQKFKDARRVEKKLAAAGRSTQWLDWSTAYESVIGLLSSGL